MACVTLNKGAVEWTIGDLRAVVANLNGIESKMGAEINTIRSASGK